MFSLIAKTYQAYLLVMSVDLSVKFWTLQSGFDVFDGLNFLLWGYIVCDVSIWNRTVNHWIFAGVLFSLFLNNVHSKFKTSWHKMPNTCLNINIGPAGIHTLTNKSKIEKMWNKDIASNNWFTVLNTSIFKSGISILDWC